MCVWGGVNLLADCCMMVSVPEIDIHAREFVKTNEKLGSFKVPKGYNLWT